MAVANAWQRSLQGEFSYGSPLKQGTGWNPIHAIRGGDGRNIAPNGTSVVISEDLVQDDYVDSYGFSYEDVAWDANRDYGYGPESPRELGIDDRPVWGDDLGTRASVPPNYPPYNQKHLTGLPGGTHIRSVEKGAIASTTPNVVPDEDVAQGWRNKVSLDDELPVTVSDPSQYEMQTSMTQRRKVRAGSQNSGSQSEYDAPIHSRIVGPKLKFWSGEQRHYDMAPKEQNVVIRPWWARTAGTGNPDNMQANEFYVTNPLQRTPPSDPWQGEVLPLSVDADTGNYGFTAEDYTF